MSWRDKESDGDKIERDGTQIKKEKVIGRGARERGEERSRLTNGSK